MDFDRSSAAETPLTDERYYLALILLDLFTQRHAAQAGILSLCWRLKWKHFRHNIKLRPASGRRWRSWAITVNRLGRYAVAIFDPYRFFSNIVDGYAPSAKAFYQLRCCCLALARLGCFIKR
jgi:hypothetical protein